MRLGAAEARPRRINRRYEMDLQRIREAAERIALSEGMEVVDVEWKIGKQRLLRVYIDRPEGTPGSAGSSITHRDCEMVSEQLSVVLDVEDLVPGPGYVLEVSSPGLDRKLTKPAEYERFAGRRAKIWTAEPVALEPGAAATTKFFEGRLQGFVDGKVRLELEGREPRVIELPFTVIRKANLVVEH